MLRLSVRSSTMIYEIEIESGSLVSGIQGDFAIVDSKFRGDTRWNCLGSFSLQANEKFKTLGSVSRALEAMAKNGMTRSSSFFAIGGGLIQDVATLSFSLYMRGVVWEYVPTTLMAMVDSCIGGKSSINLGKRKNVIGNFYPPRRVRIDPTLISTQSSKDLVCGLTEAAKIQFAKGGDCFYNFLANPASLEPQPGTALDQLVSATLESKKWFIENDEFDRGPRLLLNFGHTFGHALEGASNYKVPHGISVGLGMLAALDFAGPTKSQLARDLRDYLVLILSSLRAEIASYSTEIDWRLFEKNLLSDKKGSASHLLFVLPDSCGRLELKKLPKDSRVVQLARESMNSALEMMG